MFADIYVCNAMRRLIFDIFGAFIVPNAVSLIGWDVYQLSKRFSFILAIIVPHAITTTREHSTGSIHIFRKHSRVSDMKWSIEQVGPPRGRAECFSRMRQFCSINWPKHRLERVPAIWSLSANGLRSIVAHFQNAKFMSPEMTVVWVCRVIRLRMKCSISTSFFGNFHCSWRQKDNKDLYARQSRLV